MTVSAEDYLALWWHGEVRAPEDHLVAWARQERMLPLLGWRSQAQSWRLPETLERAVRLRRRQVIATQARADEQLKALGAAAREIDIPAILVKGAVAAEAYPAPWMRPYGDIDLLIAESDGPRFLQAVRALGYRVQAGKEGRRAWHYPRMVPSSPGLHLEVHTALARDRNRSQFTMTQFRGRLHPLAAYPGLSRPSTVDHVLYLIHHAVIHHEMGIGLQPLADLGFITQGWAARVWDDLFDEARRFELEQAAGLAFALCSWFWNEPYRAARRFPTPPVELLSAAKRTVTGATNATHMPNIWRDIPTLDLKGVLKYIHTILLGDPEQLRALPARKRWAFLFRRPGKLLHSHAPSIWRLVKGDPDARAAWRAQRELQSWLRGE